MRHISNFIKSFLFSSIIILMPLTLLSCDWDWEEYWEESENVNTSAGHIVYYYTEDVLIKYTDLFFFIRQLQSKLQQNSELAEEPLFFLPDGTVYVEENEEGKVIFRYAVNGGDNRPQYDLDVNILDESMQTWLVEARSRDRSEMAQYSMYIAMNGDRWTISDCSSKPYPDTASAADVDYRYSFLCNITTMNLRWMNIEPGRQVFELKVAGTLESLAKPALTIDYNTKRPIIVVDNIYNYAKRVPKGREGSRRWASTAYFTQWLTGTIVLNVFDPIDNTYDEIIGEVLDGFSNRITYRGAVSDYDW